MATPRLRPLTPAALAAIEDPCQHCGYPTRGTGPQRNGSRPVAVVDRRHGQRSRREQRSRPSESPAGHPAVGPDWAVEVTDLWGLCGVAAHLGGEVPGYLTFAPAELMPSLPLPGPGGRSLDAVGPQSFSPDAAVITAVEVCAQHRRHGIGRDLVRSALAQLGRRQVGQVEVTAVLAPKPLRYADTGSGAAVVMLPIGFWQALGFRTIRPHPLAPVLRLELESTARWLPDFATAWKRFAELVSQPGPAQPASFQQLDDTDRTPTTAS